eukprot:6210524-Pleurochrysis_carterae.AAC.1
MARMYFSDRSYSFRRDDSSCAWVRSSGASSRPSVRSLKPAASSACWDMRLWASCRAEPASAMRPFRSDSALPRLRMAPAGR